MESRGAGLAVKSFVDFTLTPPRVKRQRELKTTTAHVVKWKALRMSTAQEDTRPTAVHGRL